MRFSCCLILSFLCFWYVKCITQELGLWSLCDTVLSSSCKRVDDVLSIRRAGSRKGSEGQPKKIPARARDSNVMLVETAQSKPMGLLEQSAAAISRCQVNLNHRPPVYLPTFKG